MSTMKMIRYLVAFVFITSALMKLTNEELVNVFISLGLPYPAQLMYLVAFTEIVAGVLLVTERYVRYAVIALMVIMIAAILMTKVPTLHSGLVQGLFNARLDVVMIGLLFLLFKHYPNG